MIIFKLHDLFVDMPRYTAMKSVILFRMIELIEKNYKFVYNVCEISKKYLMQFTWVGE